MAAAATIRSLVLARQFDEASEHVARLVESLTGSCVVSIDFTSDEYSLNSVSGRVRYADGDMHFFKFHVEEGEEGNVGEYYRAQVLADAGLPVEVPVAVSPVPGEQFVLYEVRTEPRMVDVCLDLERAAGPQALLPDDLHAAREVLDQRIGDVLVRTVRSPVGAEAVDSSLHQLFHHRLTTPAGEFPGGRYASWYLPDSTWNDLSARLWKVNGVTYGSTLLELVESAQVNMDPRGFAQQAVATAHGDDHHGNVWVIKGDEGTELRLFDPAFAGSGVPALLALIKPTFHNVFAHPNWLYHPGEIDLGSIEVDQVAALVSLTDAIELSPLRRQVLDSIVSHAWIPLLSQLKSAGQLPPNWRQIVRSGLFLCPFLVTNLVSPDRPELVRILGLGHAVTMGSEPSSGTDPLTEALDLLQREIGD
ncbi:MAG: hypothetical protein WCI29_11780 [Actinomycetes bacterium]|jgi:hypothetical protein